MKSLNLRSNILSHFTDVQTVVRLFTDVGRALTVGHTFIRLVTNGLVVPNGLDVPNGHHVARFVADGQAVARLITDGH